MSAKIITAVYLTVMIAIAGNLLFRKMLVSTPEDNAYIKRLLTAFCVAFGSVAILIFLKSNRSTSDLLIFSIVFSFCPFLWLMLRYLTRYDYKGGLNIFLAALLISATGIVMQYRMNLYTNQGIMATLMGGKAYFTVTQFAATTLGILIFMIGLLSGFFKRAIDWAEHKSSTLSWGVISFCFMLLPPLLGKAVGGTSSWLFGRSIQPSEFIFRISLVIFICRFLNEKNSLISLPGSPIKELIKNTIKLALLILVFFIGPLMVQNELGTALVIYLTILFMVSYASKRWLILPIGIALLIGIVTFFVKVPVPIFHEKVEKRVVKSFLDWEQHVADEGWQIMQAQAATQASAIWGRGLTLGRPKMKAVTSDFMIIAVVHELGIWGLSLILLAFWIFLKEALCHQSPSRFRELLVMGIPVSIMSQAFYNIGSTLIDKLPVTGVPIWGLSNGTSSIIAGWLMLGVMTVLVDEASLIKSGSKNV